VSRVDSRLRVRHGIRAGRCVGVTRFCRGRVRDSDQPPCDSFGEGQLGPERTAAVIRGKPWYTWIYATILADEKQIAGVVDRHHLRVP
jgi:hypothetical protein